MVRGEAVIFWLRIVREISVRSAGMRVRARFFPSTGASALRLINATVIDRAILRGRSVGFEPPKGAGFIFQSAAGSHRYGRKPLPSRSDGRRSGPTLISPAMVRPSLEAEPVAAKSWRRVGILRFRWVGLGWRRRPTPCVPAAVDQPGHAGNHHHNQQKIPHGDYSIDFRRCSSS